MGNKMTVEETVEDANGGKDGAVATQMTARNLPSSSTDCHGTFDGGDRLRARLVSLGDLEESESEEMQGKVFVKESAHLLNIFPEEIWLMILDNVEDADTLQSLHDASPYFRNLLLPRRSFYLFPKVWSILAKKFDKLHSTDPAYNETMTDTSPGARRSKKSNPETKWTCKDCHRVGSTKWYSGILKLRLVCKTWSKAVDQSLEVSDVGGATSTTWTFDEFELEDDIRSFIRHFHRTHYNMQPGRSPFLGRHILLQYDSSCYYNLCRNLLRYYGRHIYSISISDSLAETTVHYVYAYTSFQQFITLMPNLKVLMIKSTTLETPCPQVLAALRRRIELNPIPYLENLQHLTCHGAPTSVFNEIIHRNSHLQTLDTDQGNCEPGMMPYDLYSTPVPNLQELSINVYCGDFLRKLVRPSSFQPPLQKLCLKLKREFYVEWPNIFHVIGYKFGETLTHLELQLPLANRLKDKEKILKKCHSFRLNLPKLVNLKLEIRNLSSFDFLLPMKDSLETLELTIIVREVDIDQNVELFMAVCRNQVIQIFDIITGRLLESNICKLFLKLTHVKVFETVFYLDGSQKFTDYMYTRPGCSGKKYKT